MAVTPVAGEASSYDGGSFAVAGLPDGTGLPATAASPVTLGLAPAARPALIDFVLPVAAVVLWTAALLEARPVPVARIDVPWWALVVVFGIAESLVLHIHFRRAVHSISFRELGLVLGLYVLSPGALLVAQLVGAGTALTVVAKQRPSKVAATLARLAVTTGVAFLVFHAVVPRGGPFELVGLAGATLAAVTASLLAPLLASAAALAGSGELRLRRLPAATAIAVVAAITMSCLALIGLELARQDVRLIALLALPGAIGAVAVRSSVAYSRRREHIEYLYESMSAAHGAPEFSLAVGQLLIAVRRLLRAEHAEIFLFPAGADQGLRGTLGPYGEMTAYPDVVGAADEQVLAVLEAWSGAIVLPVPRPAHPLDGYLAARDLPDAIIAALPGEHGPFGLLVVGRRWSDEPDSFTDDDRRLLETFVGHASVLLENGRLERSLAQVTDLKDRLRHQAFHDVLTGLPNRALLTERVEAAVAGGGPPAAVLFLDLDDFKSVNDTLGHAVGDELLVEVARRVQGSVRPGDTAARLGGDEFAVLLEATDEQGAAVVADSLIESLSRPFVLAGRQSNLHASIGIAHAHSAGSAAELLHNADVAMYAAKASGKARFLHYEPTMHAELRRRHDFALELQGALERDEIAIVFEPIVDLRDQRIVAFEALARWNSPDRGVVQPDEFIAVAEEMGLMVQIGRRILRQACAAAATWQAAHPEHGPIGVSVNLGASEFANGQLVEEIARVLYDTRLPAESLMLEIAENDVMRSPDSALARLDELRALGVRLFLDDFGTGHSSLERLDTFPFDAVKIAKPFVDRLLDARSEPSFIDAFVRLAYSLDMQCIAEGVEHESQIPRLLDRGCAMGQGHVFAAPMRAGEIGGLLRSFSRFPS